ncbi:MAG: NRDE family protein [Polyangiaceae bacterium]|nr:NRDE family protein [Polyangiaceae bacterium]
MCVLFIAWRSHPRYRLVLAGNRDELRARPTAPLDRWPDRPDVIGGRDLKDGGSWLAASAGGRFAAVTNFRQLPLVAGRRSRGALAFDFVCGGDAPLDFVREAAAHAADYGGVNLFAGAGESLWHWSNRGDVMRPLSPGLYGLSNGMLEDDWPKMRRGREALTRLVAADAVDEEALFELLADRTPGDDDDLPDTGVGRDLERMLSPIFIAGEDYGTRSSTVLWIGHDGSVRMRERRWGAGGALEGETALTL